MGRELLIYPDSRLRQQAEPITILEFNSAWLELLIDDMDGLIYAKGGVGLAAIQIGVNKSVIVYKEPSGEVKVLCNAKIVKSFGSIVSLDEGCLSVPGFRADVQRFKGIKIKAKRSNGSSITIKERGFQAIILQHEIDHLEGRQFIDRVSSDNQRKQDYLESL